MTLENWNEIISDDFKAMKSMLDRIEARMSTHLNGQQKFEYIKPVKAMIQECFLDVVENGVTFTEVNNQPTP